MLYLLLKQNEVEALHMLSLVIYSPSASVSLINERILNNKMTLKKNTTLLNDTFLSLGLSELHLEQHEGHLTLANYNATEFDSLLVEVYNHFVKNSLTFHTLQVMMTQKQPTKESIMATIHISESYFSKILKEINQFIQPAGIHIVSRKKLLVFEGPDRNADNVSNTLYQFI